MRVHTCMVHSCRGVQGKLHELLGDFLTGKDSPDRLASLKAAGSLCSDRPEPLPCPLEKSWAGDSPAESESSRLQDPPGLPRPRRTVRTAAFFSAGTAWSWSGARAGPRGREDGPALTIRGGSHALCRRSHGGHPQCRGLAGGPGGGQ